MMRKTPRLHHVHSSKSHPYPPAQAYANIDRIDYDTKHTLMFLRASVKLPLRKATLLSSEVGMQRFLAYCVRWPKVHVFLFLDLNLSCAVYFVASLARGRPVYCITYHEQVLAITCRVTSHTELHQNMVEVTTIYSPCPCLLFAALPFLIASHRTPNHGPVLFQITSISHLAHTPTNKRRS